MPSSHDPFYYFKVAHVNVNCLSNKVNYIFDFLYNNDVSVLGVSESWLLPSTPSSVVAIPNYSIVRRDVDGNRPKHGVCLYIKSNLKYTLIELPLPNILAIFLPDFGLTVVTVYRPPSYSHLENESLINFLYNFCKDKEMIIMGDFNLPSIRWTADPVSRLGIPALELEFLNCFISLGLNQLILEPTFYPSGNILDLLFVSETDRTGEACVLPPLPNCGHSPIITSYIFQGPPSDSLSREIKVWHKGDYSEINNILESVDWDFEFSNLDTDSMFNHFCDILAPLIELYVPTRILSNSTNPPWPVRPPPALKNDRKRQWRDYKSVRNIHGRTSQEAVRALRQFLDINHQYRNYTITNQSNYEL